EAGEADEVDMVCFELGLHGALEGFAILAEAFVIDHRGRDAFGLCGGKSARIRLVGQHQRNLRRIIGGPRGFDQRGHVGAAAGNQHGDTFARRPGAHARVKLPVVCTGSTPSARGITSPRSTTASPLRASTPRTCAALSGATTTTMP